MCCFSIVVVKVQSEIEIFNSTKNKNKTEYVQTSKPQTQVLKLNNNIFLQLILLSIDSAVFQQYFSTAQHHNWLWIINATVVIIRYSISDEFLANSAKCQQKMSTAEHIFWLKTINKLYLIIICAMNYEPLNTTLKR